MVRRAYSFNLVGSKKMKIGEGTQSHISFPRGQFGSVEMMVSVPLLELTCMVDHLHRQWKGLVYIIETPVYFILIVLISTNCNSLKFSKGTNTASFSVVGKKQNCSHEGQEFGTSKHHDYHWPTAVYRT